MDKTIIKKPAPTQFSLHPLIENRWSPRAFSKIPISNNDIKILLEAGRWAPSSNNLQPWAIIWGSKGSKSYERILNCLDSFNKSWAINAPLLMLTAYNTKTPEGKENFHALHDVGLFVGTMSLQAQSMGLGVHQMAGVDQEESLKEFKLPKEYHIATALAIGFYGGDLDDLENDLREQETDPKRNRKPLNVFVFNGDYINRADLDD